MKSWVFIIFTVLALHAGAQASTTAPLEARETALAHQLRCVVCQNQTVAESQAPIAIDMRSEIAKQLAQGQSDEEIIAFFEQRYGSFVRYTPPWRPSTWLLWCLPFIALLCGFWMLYRSVHHRAANRCQRLNHEDRLRAQAWLERTSQTETSETHP